MLKLTEYVETSEAAEILGVSQNTLCKWTASGAIPMHRDPAKGYRLLMRVELEKQLARVERAVKPKS